MRILFLSRATLYTNAGGDTMQVVNTASELKKLGVGVDIRLSNETIDYSFYDLLHFFNIVRPADILYHIEKSHKPYVVSTIFVDYLEYEKKVFGGARKILFHLLSADSIEYLKVLARAMVNREKINSLFYLLNGHKKSVKKVITGAALLLPNSDSEYARLVERYSIDHRYRVIPNGINRNFFNVGNDKDIQREANLVICVARIEPLKNQLTLIKALNNSSYKLVIIGSPSTNQRQYYERCKKEAAANIVFVNYIPQEELIHYYKRAKVHVLASWFETTGLSSLEAGVMGCNIVITDKGDTREYFKDQAYYCRPESVESILTAVREAADNKVDESLSNMITQNYTWVIAAQKTLASYQEILSK